MSSKEREIEAQKLRDRTAELTAQVERLKRDLNERDVTLTTMRDEVTSVQARLVEKVCFISCSLCLRVLILLWLGEEAFGSGAGE